jgi:hypothetical protein
LRSHIASLVRPASIGDDPGADVVLADDGKAARVRIGTAFAHAPDGWAPAMTVAASAALVEVAQRAMARTEAHRFAPLVCTDGRGAVVGIVRIDDLLIALSASSASSPSR